jgi:hypothetical protein
MWAPRLLFANAIWDLVTGLGILIYVGTGRLKGLADLHLGLWKNEEDRNNSAASVLMGCLVLQWSWMRLITALDPVNHWQDAVHSYWLEGMLVGTATIVGRMHTPSGSVVVVLCAACAAVVLVEALR